MIKGASRRFIPGSEDLSELLQMRQRGYPFMHIARHYKIDHTTVIYHCKKYGVVPGEEIILKDRVLPPVKIEVTSELEIVIPPPKLGKYDAVLYETICQGQMYVDYLKKAGIKMPKDYLAPGNPNKKRPSQKAVIKSLPPQQ